MNRNFMELLDARWGAGGRVCVGLDPVLERIAPCYSHLAHSRAGIPEDAWKVYDFCMKVAEATKDFALAFKTNYAFFAKALRKKALPEMQKLIVMLHDYFPDIPVIVDLKRGDIGKTNDGYVAEAFDVLVADALTISPYFGLEANRPFLDRADRGVIVLVRTSNDGAEEFQNLPVRVSIEFAKKLGTLQLPYVSNEIELDHFAPFYKVVAYNVAHEWDYNGNCAVVVGATAPEELAQVRRIVGDDMWILIPGVGAQGGSLAEAVRNGINSRGRGVLINNSSALMYAYEKRPDLEPHQFADAARDVAVQMYRTINAILDDRPIVR